MARHKIRTLFVREGHLTEEGIRALRQSELLDRLDPGEYVLREEELETANFAAAADSEKEAHSHVLCRKTVGEAVVVNK